ncbi:MAG: ABC transporter permease [Bacteroidetes bacterium]|nr:ABC transporter permease [Bacteroidota bacterium]
MVIGIFLIIFIGAAVDALKKNINDSISRLGDEVIFVHKWPWEGGFNYPFWKYLMRPQPNPREAFLLQERLENIAFVSFQAESNAQVRSSKFSIESAPIYGQAEGMNRVSPLDIEKGRSFSEMEILTGRDVCIIGPEVAENLFPGAQPIGQTLRIGARKFAVIGLTKTQGESLIDIGEDGRIYVPFGSFKALFGVNGSGIHREIVVKPKLGVPRARVKNELMGAMRGIRKIHPLEEEDFTLNEASMIAKETAGITNVLNLVALLIGGMAILVGGFGVANILFVSVKERIPQIGLQKALGAKRSFILWQFLFEAISLSMLGGLLGLLLVYLSALGVRSFSDFEMVLSFDNVVRGLWVSSLVGLIAGIAPAWSASKLPPVEAIRQGG